MTDSASFNCCNSIRDRPCGVWAIYVAQHSTMFFMGNDFEKMQYA